MKMFSLKTYLGLAAIALTMSACGGGGSGPVNQQPYQPQNPPQNRIDAINLTDLPAGYQLNGYVKSGEDAGKEVKLIFCPDYRYSYYRGDKNYNGTYELRTDLDEVVMKDKGDGGSYALKAKNGMFEVGNDYDCPALKKYTTGLVLTKILQHPCPNDQ